MADDDSKPDPESSSQPPGAGAGDGPPPLDAGAVGGDSAGSEANVSSAAESMESSLPDALKGGVASGVALGQGSMSEKDEKTFGLLVHILGVIPLLGPLVLWMMKRDESPFINDQGRESVAYQLVFVIALVAIGILTSIPGLGCITWILWPVAGVMNLVMVVMAGLKAGDGVAYRYPFALRVL